MKNRVATMWCLGRQSNATTTTLQILWARSQRPKNARPTSHGSLLNSCFLQLLLHRRPIGSPNWHSHRFSFFASGFALPRSKVVVCTQWMLKFQCQLGSRQGIAYEYGWGEDACWGGLFLWWNDPKTVLPSLYLSARWEMQISIIRSLVLACS